MRITEHQGVACGVSLALWLVSGAASAYCRTTTCDVDKPPPSCAGNTTSKDGCSTLGEPLHWPGRCAWFGVQKDGSALRSIPYPTFHDTVQRAFQKWASVDCGGGQHPSFDMTDTDELYGAAVCDASEFNPAAANASVWMFRDSSWPHTSANSEIALTQVSADVNTGAIYDADVEVNSFGVNISSSNTNVQADLDAIVTHEAGHFLGLAHSLDPNATMNAGYYAHTTSLRDLAPDDIAGICAAYPPSEGAPTCGEPEPMFGFSRFCGGVSPSTTPDTAFSAAAGSSGGCSLARQSQGGSLSLALIGLAVLGRRRFRGRPRARAR